MSCVIVTSFVSHTSVPSLVLLLRQALLLLRCEKKTYFVRGSIYLLSTAVVGGGMVCSGRVSTLTSLQQKRGELSACSWWLLPPLLLAAALAYEKMRVRVVIVAPPKIRVDQGCTISPSYVLSFANFDLN